MHLRQPVHMSRHSPLEGPGIPGGTSSIRYPSVYVRLIVGILPGTHRRETGGAGRNLAPRWLFQASAEGLGDLLMQTISLILALEQAVCTCPPRNR